MIRPSVAEFYAGKCVFVTGASGFIGKTVVEKLLRCCPDLDKIFLLIREKKNQTPEQRLGTVLESKLFDTLKAENPECFKKLYLVLGDITEERLGLSDQDHQVLLDNVHVVIHVAASINFSEPLRNALKTNVFAVNDVIDLCDKCKNLKAFVHCSTGFVKLDLPVIEEKLYEFKTDYKKILKLSQSISDSELENMASQLLGDTPNSYVYTKLMAECLLADEAKHLPLAIVRPTLVISMWKDDPIRGWIDSIAHLSGVQILAGKGYMRAILANSEKAVDLIPVDVVSNVLITSAWKLGTSRGDEIDVYNVSSSCIKRVTWGRLTLLAKNYYNANPLKDPMRTPFVYLIKHAWLFNLLILFYHTLPAKVIDSIARVRGHKANMMKLINKLHTFVDVISYFALREWYWKTDNSHHLQSEMSPADARKFPLVPTELIWESYLIEFSWGIRRYLLKESLADVENARKRVVQLHRARFVAEFLAITIGLYLMYRIALIMGLI